MYGPDGSVDKHTTHLYSKYFSQVEGIDYTNTFSFIDKMNSTHLVPTIIVSHKWEVHQMDVKSVLLHGDLQEKIYLENPLGYAQNEPIPICFLQKISISLRKSLRLGMIKWRSFF